ncbi:hypothetical protein D9M68_891570 [compost metagenome]
MLGQLRNQRVGILGVERLHRVSDGIQSTGHADLRRETEGQVNVVENDFRKYLECALGGFQAVFSLTDDRRRFRSGVGCRNHDLRQVGVQRNRLAQPYGGAAAERYHAIGVALRHHVQGFARHFHRRVHGGVGVQAHTLVAELFA